ncbi:hypothetical protein [Rhizobium sp. L1K21]|uniref:hypothetical protein n=1 Tax=Rhizobium sp. L1K21 TaxID=2954933 RepID=UPI002093A368|nr:hypothetical protein [Rhizobium sp. L1K21]MCO6186611.1 hypothetical protein [Rhizobium sp. L1K21]
MVQAKNTTVLSRRLSDGDSALDIHAEPTIDELLSGEPSRHFPEKRNRRADDSDRTVIARLYSALEAIDRGEVYTGDNDEDHHLMEDCYRQF